MPARIFRPVDPHWRALGAGAFVLCAWACALHPAAAQAVETNDEYTAQPPREDAKPAEAADTGTATPIAPRTLDESLHGMRPSDREAAEGMHSFRILDGSIPPGETLQVPWYASDSFTGLAEPTPVLVAHGTQP
ncbi:MAG: hypothetical protein ACX94A_10020, partial [Algiphilus sp.]